MEQERIGRRSGGPRVAALRAARLPSRSLALACVLLAAATAHAQSLPDAPSALLDSAEAQAQTQAPMPGTASSPSQTSTVAPAGASPVPRKHLALPPCQNFAPMASPEAAASIQSSNKVFRSCKEENPLQTIVSTPDVRPLNYKQKFHLAVHDVKDPFNLLVLTATTGISVAANPHNADGPGLPGFGRALGYNAVQDMTGEFFATFAIPSLAHQDPRYHRMGGKNLPRRVLHAVVHTYVSQHDDGRLMPNVATLGVYWIGPNLASLYVPGAAVSERTIAHGALLGIATDPTGTLIGEFLPDIAKHIHVHFYIAQQALQQFTQTTNPAVQ